MAPCGGAGEAEGRNRAAAGPGGAGAVEGRDRVAAREASAGDCCAVMAAGGRVWAEAFWPAPARGGAGEGKPDRGG